MPIYNPASGTSNLSVLKNGTTVGTRPTVNFIEGSQVSLTVADNAPSSEVDVTIAATAGGTSTTGPVRVGTVSTVGEGSMLAEASLYTSGNFTNDGVWGLANRAIFVPVQVQFTTTIYQLAWLNGTVVSGNVDCAIYDESYNRLVSAGSTAQAGTSVYQAVDTADTVLSPGTYFLALVLNNATGRIFSTAPALATLRMSGVLSQTAAFPLPNPAAPITTADGTCPVIVGAFESAVF